MNTYEGYTGGFKKPSKITIRKPLTTLNPRLIEEMFNLAALAQFYGQSCIWQLTDAKYIEACELLRRFGYRLSIQP